MYQNKAEHRFFYEYDGGEKDNSLPVMVSAHRVGGLDNSELY